MRRQLFAPVREAGKVGWRQLNVEGVNLRPLQVLELSSPTLGVGRLGVWALGVWAFGRLGV